MRQEKQRVHVRSEGKDKQSQVWLGGQQKGNL